MERCNPQLVKVTPFGISTSPVRVITPGKLSLQVKSSKFVIALSTGLKNPSKPARIGAIQVDPSRDVPKIVLIQRDGRRRGCSLLSGFGARIEGTISLLPMRELAREVEKLKRVFRDFGCLLEDPIWTMGFLSFTSVVEVRITPSGVYDVKKGKVIF